MTKRLNAIDTTDFFQALEQQFTLPEERLLVAIVQRALMDYISPEHGKAHWQYDAGAWLFSSSQTPYSLYWICEILSEAPTDLQKRIQFAAKTKVIRAGGVIMRVDTK